MKAVVTTIILATLLAAPSRVTSNSVPQSEVDGTGREARSIVDTVMNLLEKFRQSMKSPNSGLGLPQLDPLQLTNISLNIDIVKSQIALQLPRLKVDGLSTFVVEQLQVNALFLRANFGFSIADIVATGTYSVNGRLLDLLSVFGNGDFSIEAVNFNVTNGFLQIGYLNNSLNIKNLTLDFNLDALKVNLGGLFGGGDVGDLVNKILNDVALNLVLDYKQEIISYATGELIKKADSFLKGKSLSDLGNVINGAGGATSPGPSP